MYMAKIEKSSLSPEIIENIFNLLMDYYKVTTYADLARALGYDPSNIQKWRERGSLPVNKIIRNDSRLNPDFLYTGNGPVENSTASDRIIEYSTARNPIDQKLIDLQRTLSVASALPKSDHAKLDAVQDSVELMRSLLRDLEELVRAQKGKADADS